MRDRQRVRFAEFEVDFHAGELSRCGVKIKLQRQPLQVLQLLLEQSGKLVTREELRQKIWPSDTFVDFEQGCTTPFADCAMPLRTPPTSHVSSRPSHGVVTAS